ncbi:unnamed protein product [Phytophthora lilii]|uniref:Unnamed protein product n=1 Tax=Phytophthora lilii TaxID=2077276 RepID=A0A9W6TN51_9STRA|nr:unnamed protein product [Phytophthora lilii]
MQCLVGTWLSPAQLWDNQRKGAHTPAEVKPDHFKALHPCSPPYAWWLEHHASPTATLNCPPCHLTVSLPQFSLATTTATIRNSSMEFLINFSNMFPIYKLFNCKSDAD